MGRAARHRSRPQARSPGPELVRRPGLIANPRRAGDPCGPVSAYSPASRRETIAPMITE
jgi:hypothetical protein